MPDPYRMLGVAARIVTAVSLGVVVGGAAYLARTYRRFFQ